MVLNGPRRIRSSAHRCVSSWVCSPRVRDILRPERVNWMGFLKPSSPAALYVTTWQRAGLADVTDLDGDPVIRSGAQKPKEYRKCGRALRPCGLVRREACPAAQSSAVLKAGASIHPEITAQKLAEACFGGFLDLFGDNIHELSTSSEQQQLLGGSATSGRAWAIRYANKFSFGERHQPSEFIQMHQALI